ncbi:MAG: fibronectin type III domain-containing protein, partial [Tepidisphaeraceae bacterium]
LDYFSFSTGAGNVNITLAVPDAVNNLDSKLELRSANGLSLITASAPSNSFGATVSANLAAGSYQLVAASHGNYGDVGQYTIHGTVAAQASNGLNAPSNLLGSANGTTGLVSLSWVDNATAEQNYVVERRTDGTSFATIATLGANSVGHVDNTATPGTTHYYQVRATNGADSSPASNVATATTVPLAPATLSATTGGSGAITLNWANVVGEQGYKVLRSTSSGGGFTQVGTTGAGVLTFNDTGLAASTTYYYHVIAYNAGGDGATSPQAFATTAAAPALPAAPSGLVATAITKTRVDLVWIDHASNEDGFRVERRLSTSNTWTQIGQIGVNVKAFSDTTAQARKTYIYRVRAFNAAGNSGYSNTAQATTPKRSPIVLASMGTRLSPRSTISSQAVGTGWVVRLSSNLFNDASTTSIFSDMAIGSGDLA